MKSICNICKAAKALCAWGVLFVFTAGANPVYNGDMSIWSIPSEQIPVPAGYCVSEAILTIRNVSVFDSNSSDLQVYLMPDTANKFYGLPERDTSDDRFSCCNLLLAELEPNNIYNNTIQIRLSQVSNTASIASPLNTPLPVQFADGNWITLSGAIQQFMDISGTHDSLAFGFDSNGFSFGSLSLLVFCRAYNGPQGLKSFLVTSGNLYPPVLDPLSEMTVMENQEITFTLNASDADDTSLFYYGSDLPDGAVLSGNRFTWTPSWTQAGSYLPRFIVSDGKNSSYIDVSITVIDSNRPPVFSPIANQTGQERKFLTFSAAAEDPDGQSVTLSALNLPNGAVFQSNRFYWIPVIGQAGRYEIVFTASDGSLESRQTVIVDIKPASAI
jgi:hypothetical protein